MSESNPFDIERLFEGSLRRLRAEAEYFSRLTEHDPELGRLNESHLVRLLRDYLPPKIGIGTGFIASGGDAPQQSPQCDIVLYDALNNAPLYRSDAWSIYPIEMVYGVIEVKTTLKKKELNDAFEKCARIRAMAISSEGGSNKAYIRQVYVPAHANANAEPEARAEGKPKGQTKVETVLFLSGPPPRFFVFAYDGWKTLPGLFDNFRNLSEEHQMAHIHGVCSLSNTGGFYVRHNAFKKGSARFSEVENNGFHHFLMGLPTTLNSMLPPERLGLGFDQAHIDRYALAVE